MHDTQMFHPLFTYVRTTHEASELLTHIDILLSQYFKVQKDPFEKIAYEVLSPVIAQEIHKIFSGKNLSWSNPEEVKAFLTGLKATVQQCEVMTITVSYEPAGEDITAFANWSRTNFAQNILLEIHVDPAIIGGAVIIYKGNYIDHSLKKKLTDYFTKDRQMLLSKIRKPTPPLQQTNQRANIQLGKTI